MFTDLANDGDRLIHFCAIAEDELDGVTPLTATLAGGDGESMRSFRKGCSSS